MDNRYLKRWAGLPYSHWVFSETASQTEEVLQEKEKKKKIEEEEEGTGRLPESKGEVLRVGRKEGRKGTWRKKRAEALRGWLEQMRDPRRAPVL